MKFDREYDEIKSQLNSCEEHLSNAEGYSAELEAKVERLQEWKQIATAYLKTLTNPFLTVSSEYAKEVKKFIKDTSI